MSAKRGREIERECGSESKRVRVLHRKRGSQVQLIGSVLQLIAERGQRAAGRIKTKDIFLFSILK